MITTVATWATKRHLSDPADSVAVMQRAGVTECSIMLNNFSAARSPKLFKTHDPDKVVALADACHAAGIGVTLTTWVMPHEYFLRTLCEQVEELADATGAHMVVLDAEEPWVRATGRMDFEDAAALIRPLVGTTTIGLTAIASANTEAIGPLADLADIWIPQCYATDGGQASPETIVDYGIARWSEKFGDRPAGHWQIGLAAYGQLTNPDAAMGACIDQVRANKIDAVCYWSLEFLRRPKVADFVASITAKPAASGGIFPVLDIASMPSGTYVRAVEHAQRLLAGWGVDPGGPDGKPGPKTLAAVREFQGKRGLAMTGVVNGGTWWSLLAE